MKVAFILPSLDNKGPIVAAKNLIDSIKENTEIIEVFYFKDIKLLNLGVKCTKISFFKSYNFDKFDIINVYMAKPDIYSSLFLNKYKNKLVTTMHNYLVEDLNHLYNPFTSFLYKIIWKYALKRRLTIIVSSLNMKEYYEKLLKNKNINLSVIEYGVPMKIVNEICQTEKIKIESIKKKFRIIGSIGLLIKRKGFHQLLYFLEKNKDYYLILIGDGEEKNNLIDLSRELNIVDRVMFLGYKENSSDYYLFFDIYAMTSYSEGCSLAMLEAMSQSLPVICSDIPNHRICFNDNEVSYFQLDNIQSLVNAIYKVDKKIDYYKQASYELFQEKFSLDVMGNKHIELYKRVMSESENR